MTFAEATKISRGWLLKLDLETMIRQKPEAFPQTRLLDYDNHQIITSPPFSCREICNGACHDEVQGTNAHSVHTRIEALNRRMMPHKSHNIGGRSKSPLLTFAEATKISRGWLKGMQFHYIQLHIEVLKKQKTLFKNHNKARSGNDDTSRTRSVPANKIAGL
ncbi:hypothetical protein BMT55_13620 [Listeria newyorkensis]|uniref:Uncharacterized protein n=1 Tax=Listeria newyorkensis TaxID=1497681 RepID=A0ABX4XIY6_9LIST|nr:hypothetical protein EP58_11320 [Listeria newyorkensis]KGL44955.1 hypothetical protein EP56_05190 [Listeriaceae bacterium FSL A5-0209]PNP89091.1 hypothetical protein BMT55_13620 [Listeria newyorkensis]RQW68340.1 hypothetical protein DUK53_02920 [Listeria sp. SHR_NRA_18]